MNSVSKCCRENLRKKQKREKEKNVESTKFANETIDRHGPKSHTRENRKKINHTKWRRTFNFRIASFHFDSRTAVRHQSTVFVRVSCRVERTSVLRFVLTLFDLPPKRTSECAQSTKCVGIYRSFAFSVSSSSSPRFALRSRLIDAVLFRI